LTTDEFRKLSAVAALLIPYDRAVLALRSPDRLDVRLFSNADDADPNAEDDLSADAEGDIGRLMTDEEARARGFGAGVRVPIRFTDGTGGFLTLLARRPQAYGDDTLQKTQALADYISAVLRHDDEVQRMSQDLLSLLTDVLDIRDVFPRVSEIVAAALPHDRLMLWLAQDQVTYVTSNDDGPSIEQPKGPEIDETAAAEFRLIGDLSREPLAISKPTDLQERVLAAGNPSFLIVNTSTRFQPLSLSFWSKQPHAFSLQDVAVARHIAGCVGLAFSHQQLADAERRAAEARACADRLEVRAETTDLNEVERRTIGQVMRETRGNKSKAAKRLGLTRTQLYGRLRKYGLDSADL